MKTLTNFSKGMGIGGWLTNYKRFNVLPEDKRLDITIGDMEHFESYITEDDVKYIASLGMDHIRHGFDQIVLEESPYQYRDVILENLHNFVTWCEKYNLRAVFNMHKALGNYCDITDQRNLLESEDLKNRFVALWSKIEDEFHGNSDIIFELLNEVVTPDFDGWNKLAEKTIDVIREKNPDRYIIIGGIDWNNPSALEYVKVYDDDKIIYTFHCYAPHEFTHQQGVLQAAALYYNRKMPYPCDDIDRYRDAHISWGDNLNPYPDLDKMDIQFLRNCLKPALDFIEKHPDKILWCGEFGTIRHCNIKYRENYMRDVITICKENDIPYCVWNYLSTPNDGNRFSLVDDDTRIILSEEMEKIIRGEF